VLVLCTTLKAVNMLALLLTPANPTLAFWILIPVLMMDAQLNAGINIANNSFMLKYSPQQNRAMFIAAGTAMAGMLGGITAIGAGYCLMQMEGWHFRLGYATWSGFHVLFAISLVFRVASIALARRVEEPKAQGARHVWRAMMMEGRAGLVRISRVLRRDPAPLGPITTDVASKSNRKAA
jgi:hypothetical protein